MANTTWYGDGTATVAVGSRTVTGVDTGWLTAVAGLTPIKVGDKFGIHVGRPIVIEQIISDTELLLADDWPGPAQTDAPYKVELTSPTIAAVEAMRQLLASLSNGNLSSIAETSVGTDDLLIGIGPGVFGTISKASLSGITASLAALGALTPAANKLPYFTGATSAAFTDLSAFSRTILDDANGGAMYATMGAGQSLAQSGWQRLPSGLIAQWGFATTSGPSVVVTFPMAFPNGVFTMTTSVINNDTNVDATYDTWATNVTSSSFRMNARYVYQGGAVVSSSNISGGYIAIGR
jgi:hypothetical protein